MSSNSNSKKEKEDLIFVCPHCEDPVLIKKINCGIFRHGVIKTTGKQVSPHANRERCDTLIREKLIYGCGKPFQIIRNASDDNSYKIQICDYI